MPLTSNISINNLQLTIDSLGEDSVFKATYPYTYPSSTGKMLIRQSEDEDEDKTHRSADAVLVWSG